MSLCPDDIDFLKRFVAGCRNKRAGTHCEKKHESPTRERRANEESAFLLPRDMPYRDGEWQHESVACRLGRSYVL